MQKKESYKHILPHFQQPGQAYFVTWCLKDAVPEKAVRLYSKKVELLKHQIDARDGRDQKFSTSGETAVTNRRSLIELKKEYYSLRQKYFKAFDTYLDAQQNPRIDLCKQKNLEIIREALNFWHGKKLENEAFCIMPNHVHWVFCLYEKDEAGKPVYLQDIMHSVKRYSANKINKVENRKGTLWQKESFDTTIRDEKHMYNVIEYTLNNPVKAGFVKNREDWPGTGIGSFQLPK
ncbi:MAG: transposase [Draconibacterium sp.]|nr:transposase [Draconibacterium sp.]